jgi:hypothetical protein
MCPVDTRYMPLFFRAWAAEKRDGFIMAANVTLLKEEPQQTSTSQGMTVLVSTLFRSTPVHQLTRGDVFVPCYLLMHFLDGEAEGKTAMSGFSNEYFFTATSFLFSWFYSEVYRCNCSVYGHLGTDGLFDGQPLTRVYFPFFPPSFSRIRYKLDLSFDQILQLISARLISSWLSWDGGVWFTDERDRAANSQACKLLHFDVKHRDSR